MLNRVDQILSGMTRRQLVALILAILAILGILDYLTGYQLSFAVFYLIPIALATWYVDMGGGLAAAFLSAFITTVAGLINAGSDPEIDAIVLWNGLTPVALFGMAPPTSSTRHDVSSSWLAYWNTQSPAASAP